MKLVQLTRNMRLFCRRVVNLGNRRLLPGQELITTPKGPGALSWRLIVKLYEQRRVVSESDPYFEELMNGPGLTNNPEFAKAWLEGEAVPPPQDPAEDEGEDEDTDESEDAPDVPPVPPAPPSTAPLVEIVAKGGGWFDVSVDGEIINENSLRKGDADKLADTYNG